MDDSRSDKVKPSGVSEIGRIFDPQSDVYLHLKMILDAIPHAICVSDLNGNIRFANIHYYTHKKAHDHRQEENFAGLPIECMTSSPIVRDVLADGKSRYGCFKVSRDNHLFYCDVIPLVMNGALIGTLGFGRGHALEELQLENKKLVRANQKLASQIHSAYRARHVFDDFLGNASNIRQVKERALKMAHTDMDVVIIGESGTGKEILAQAIHNASSRAKGPFVAVNCATLSNELMASELFGYTDGAFTGGRKGGKAGLFEAADGGTLLLDEISELALALQTRLLRVLEERQVRRVGGSEEIEVDVRVITCSNKNLAQMVNQNTFRPDLFYRLNVLSIEIPPLREHKEDIVGMARGILSRFAYREDGPLIFTEKAQKLLYHYPWPGNVRELRNAVEYAANMCTGRNIGGPDLPQWINQTPYREEEFSEGLSLEEQINRTERNIIAAMLKTYGISTDAKKEIARRLGISLSNLYGKMKALDLP